MLYLFMQMVVNSPLWVAKGYKVNDPFPTILSNLAYLQFGYNDSPCRKKKKELIHVFFKKIKLTVFILL